MNIHDVLEKKFGDKKYTMRGVDYSGLEWLDASPKPTEAELLAAYDVVVAEQSEKDIKLESYTTALSEGFDTKLGFTLSISDAAYLTMSAYADWVDRVYAAKEEAKYLPNGVILVGQDRQPVVVSREELTALLVPYGAACQQAYFLQ